MNTQVTITGEIDELELGYISGEADEAEWVTITEENLVEVGEELGLNEEAMYTLWYLAELVKDKVGADLRDIWERLDALEDRMDASL